MKKKLFLNGLPFTLRDGRLGGAQSAVTKSERRNDLWLITRRISKLNNVFFISGRGVL